MEFFTIITDAQAILHSRGVYRQVPLYARGEKVYAKYGGGFVRLSTGGSTSAMNVRWFEFDPGHGIIEDRDGAAPVYLGERKEAAE